MSTAIPDIPPTKLNGYVGFDTITEQIKRKLLKRGFQLNVILVGESGLGKSTFINTLFSSHLIESKGRRQAEEPARKTVEINSVTHVLKENEVALSLTVVDTPGYGDQIDNTNCWEPIVQYIRKQYDSYLDKEQSAARERYTNDTRIHCCLYFIAPTGHSLKPLDITVLQKLSEEVNVVPVIAKSDALTPEELAAFKNRIRKELMFHKINFYPYELSEEEQQLVYPEEIQATDLARSLIPFAVIGSETYIESGGKSICGRKTRWGTIDVEDEKHCEFVQLRNFLTRTHLQDLIETTKNVHYEAFRMRKLSPADQQDVAEAPKPYGMI